MTRKKKKKKVQENKIERLRVWPSVCECFKCNAAFTHTHMPPRAKFTDRVPLSTSAFFLKFGELPSVVDGDQQFPDEQRRQAKEQDCSCHRQKHHQNVWTLGAVWEINEWVNVHTVEKISHEAGQRKSDLKMLFPPCLLLHSHGSDDAFCCNLFLC